MHEMREKMKKIRDWDHIPKDSSLEKAEIMKGRTSTIYRNM